MILPHNPKYQEILEFIEDFIDYLSYSEIMDLVESTFDYKFSCQETFIYHLKKNNIQKNKNIPRYRCKNIKGLRKEFEKNLFKLEKLRNE